jgi:hypothetical protein
VHEISAGVEHHTVYEPVPARFGQGADTCKVARLHRGLRLDFDPYDHAIVAFNHDIHPRASANHENETASAENRAHGLQDIGEHKALKKRANRPRSAFT